MSTNTIIIDSDEIFTKKVCFFIDSLVGFDVSYVNNSFADIDKLTNCNLLIATTNSETYESDYISINKISSNNPDIMIVLLTTSATNEMITKAFLNKFAAVVDKKYFLSYYEFILENILTIKGFYVSPILAKYIFEKVSLPKTSNITLLTKKQNDVAYYLSKGYSYIEIANEMNQSVNTTRMHTRLLYRKINIKSRFELINMLQNGNLKLNPITFNPIVNKSNFIYITEKEKKVLTLLKDNKNIKEIASELSITQFSTKYYINKLKQKNLII
ncbi:LuxR C-terminal-related transcriptional regulator [Flavobacterium sp. 20NA77.7]|uniref:LuxR C-terminal-related transcriptional regulator n=1 Tax=Flavobacterium nakdongensis TaxID=3073563 RepID=A0ABY9R7S0_9FLAO|nr:LuxR C-terminal-related transcriptional regulator [Flavobacterium sp. 20NA77.7]WMW77317.1 LuxR C-terminal-related transcriptional regulator [Flavobacterium sp. 20NA77.7]